MHTRVFDSQLQDDFAALSGDYNPVHMDALAARRSLFGAPVVHGVHALLWTLDVLCPGGSNGTALELLEVKAVFGKPIAVGEAVSIQPEATRNVPDGVLAIKARLIVNGGVVTTISAKFRHAGEPLIPPMQPLMEFPAKMPSRELGDAQMVGLAGTLPLYLPTAAARALFPSLVRCLPASQLASLLATTRLVGVHCPGLNSVFSEIALYSNQGIVDELAYKVSNVDERFALVTIDIAAPGIGGQLGAFRRPEVRQQAAYPDFLQLLEAGEFSECRALVVGGSRGLGEVAAKILCAGGAEVRLTYHQGERDAAAVVQDITAHGGNVSAYSLDIADAALATVQKGTAGVWVPTHVLYFATPHIFSGVKGVFSPRLFNRFCDYFVLGFSRVFYSLSAQGTRYFFLPSTSAIDEMPLDMGEYIAAKAAAEYAARIFEKSGKGISISQPRLPRLATDQTVTIAESEDADPVPVMLAAIRDFVNGVGERD